jgi:hypothetical protein
MRPTRRSPRYFKQIQRSVPALPGRGVKAFVISFCILHLAGFASCSHATFVTYVTSFPSALRIPHSTFCTLHSKESARIHGERSDGWLLVEDNHIDQAPGPNFSRHSFILCE